jgi:hypothetical protein
VVGQADGHAGKIVQEEGVEMIRIEDHHHIRLDGLQVLGHVAEQLGRLRLWSLAGDEGGKHRCMRHAEACHDLGHG